MPSTQCIAGCAGRAEPFNESAAQVQRLVNRDRKELLGNEVDILDKYETEFGDAETISPKTETQAPEPPRTEVAGTSPASSSNGSSAASTASPTATKGSTSAAVQPKFGASSGVSSPFGGAPTRLKRSSNEPVGLSPDMSPDPIVKPAKDPRSWFSRITLTQVVSAARA